MFINIRLGNLFKMFFIIAIIILLVIFGIGIYRIHNKSKNSITQADSEIIDISPSNYTNALKAVHDNLGHYNGKKIHFTGYVYRVFDLTENQFVLARNMLISTDNKYVVVGFLCNYENAKNLKDNTWVEITGTIKKGNYHGEIPIIKIEEINTVDCPTDEFVFPPDDSFVPTNSII